MPFMAAYDATGRRIYAAFNYPGVVAHVGAINLDTGAYFTNRLSCLVLEGTSRRLLDLGTRAGRSSSLPSS